MKSIQGKVISNKMNKTIVVEVNRNKIHPIYKKIIKRSKKIKAHVESLKINIGDIVRIKQTRPIAKDKHYIVEKVIKK